MIERERTYLIKKLPEDLHKHPVQEILDVYIMGQDGMAQIRARKKGKTYELTKKVPIDQNNTSIQKEETFEINEDEFDYLYTYLPFKIKKKRYAYKKGNIVYDIDVFDGEMK
jgi:CYTH domain-containing protein